MERQFSPRRLNVGEIWRRRKGKSSLSTSLAAMERRFTPRRLGEISKSGGGGKVISLCVVYTGGDGKAIFHQPSRRNPAAVEK
jgi:hypothetical protein